MTKPRDHDNEDNEEQREADQAQDVAEDALAPDAADNALDSRKPDGGITDDDSNVHDTVDLMKQMVTSGRIDMGAFAGEPLMDDGDDAMPGTPAGPCPQPGAAGPQACARTGMGRVRSILTPLCTPLASNRPTNSEVDARDSDPVGELSRT